MAAVLVQAELRIIFSIVCFRVRSSSNTCPTTRMVRELNPEKESKQQLYADKLCEQLGLIKGIGESEAEHEYGIEGI